MMGGKKMEGRKEWRRWLESEAGGQRKLNGQKQRICKFVRGEMGMKEAVCGGRETEKSVSERRNKEECVREEGKW